MATTVVILGSPRKGNSEAIAMAVAAEAKAKGNTIKEYKLNQLKNTKGCQSCYGCKKCGKCVVKDDILPILDDIREADSIILATPTYFGYSTAQFRMLEDRFFSFVEADFKPNIAGGKKVAVIETCGSGLEEAEKNADRIAGVWKNFFGADVVGKIVAGNMMAPNAAAENADIMAQAKALGQKL